MHTLYERGGTQKLLFSFLLIKSENIYSGIDATIISTDFFSFKLQEKCFKMRNTRRDFTDEHDANNCETLSNLNDPQASKFSSSWSQSKGYYLPDILIWD